MLLTIDTIDQVWSEYWKEQVWQNYIGTYVPMHEVLRFGQYVYNRIGYETYRSYNIKDPTEAYNNLCDDINASVDS